MVWSTWPRIALPAAALGLALAGCRGGDLENDCDRQSRQFSEQVEEETKPLVEIPEEPPFMVAFQLTEEGVNRLLGQKVNESDIPFTGDLPFGPAGFSFTPESEPTIKFADLPRCPNCLVLNLEFEVQLSNAGEPISTGFGAVDLAIPMELVADEATGTTTLVADYGQVVVDEMDLSVYGFSTDDNKQYGGAIQILLTERLQEEFGQVELLSIGSWQIGDGNVRLLARELQVFPEHGKLALGMTTNLPLPEAAGLFLDQPLPDDVPMAVTFDSRLFLAMTHQMMAEGQIARRYNDSGNPDSRGDNAVTIDTMVGNANGASQLDSEFNVWRIDDGYCGNVRAAMPLTLEITESRKGFTVAAGGATLLEGEGSGVEALQGEYAADLREQSEDLITNFQGSLESAIGTTINYDAFDVEGSVIVIDVVDLTVSTGEVNSYLDFQVYEDPEAGE